MWNKLDYRLWNGTIPALTICYHNRIDEDKAQLLIKRFWNVTSEDEEFSFFLDFIKTVANISIPSLRIFNRFAGDKRLEAVDMFDIVKEVHPDINMLVTSFDPNLNPPVVEVMTERGICYSINAILASTLLSTRYLQTFIEALKIKHQRLYYLSACKQNQK